MSDIESILDKKKTDDKTSSAIQVALMYDYLEARGGEIIQADSVLAARVALHNQTLTPLVLEDCKTDARRVGPAVLHTGIFPGGSYNNDTACVAGRITAIRNTVVPPSIYSEYAREFLSFIPPSEGRPLMASDVIDRQDGKLQQVRSEKENLLLSKLSLLSKHFKRNNLIRK